MLEKELHAAIEAARRAEKAIMEVYSKPFAVEIKQDDSPVTEADKKADAIIRAYLSSVFPEDGFLTEESEDSPERFSKKRVWIVDPVDGTKEFVSKNGEFATNIALCEGHEIVLGIINAPALRTLYYAIKGEGAYRINPDGSVERIHVDPRQDGLRVMRSISFFRPEEEDYLRRNAHHFLGEPIAVGAALKFAALAEGKMDFFVRLSPCTKEWDVASGDLIVREAGGFVCEPTGEAFVYNREDVYNRKGYIMGNVKLPWMLDF